MEYRDNNFWKIYSSKHPILKMYEQFVQINGNYILGNGILFDKNCNLLWKCKWKHSYAKLYFLKKNNLLISDRVTMVGPATLNAGICCIDLSTGNYRWKHWYSLGILEQIAFFKKTNSIKLENLDKCYFNDDQLFTENFQIDILSGRYKKTKHSPINKNVNPASLNKDIITPLKTKMKSVDKIEVSNTHETILESSDIVSSLINDQKTIELLITTTNQITLLRKVEGKTVATKTEALSNYSLNKIKAYNLFDEGVLIYLKHNNYYQLFAFKFQD